MGLEEWKGKHSKGDVINCAIAAGAKGVLGDLTHTCVHVHITTEHRRTKGREIVPAVAHHSISEIFLLPKVG